MAAPIATRLVLNAKAFTKGISTATKGVGVLGGAMAKLGGIIARAGLAFTALAGVMSAVIVRQTAFLARLQDTSDKLGIGVGFLQKFRYAAEQSGVSVETADMALQRFTRRIAEANQGMGEARGALAQLGISTTDSAGKLRPMEEILFDVADGIASTGDEAERVRLAFKFFDSEGVALVNTLKDGGDALENMFNRAQQLGIVLSADAVKGAKAFDDSLTNLSKVIGGLATRLTSELAPVLKDIVDQFVDFIVETAEAQGGFEEFGKYLKDQFLGIIQNVIVSFAKLYNTIVSIMNGIVRALDFVGLGSDIANVRKNLEDFKQLEGQGFLENFFDLDNWQVTTGKAAEILEKEMGSVSFPLTEANVKKAIAALEKGLGELQTAGASDFMLDPISPEALANLTNFFEQYKEAAKVANEEVYEEVKVIGEQMGFTFAKLLDDIFGEERMTEFWNKFDDGAATSMDKVKAIGELLFDTAKDFVVGLADRIQASGIGDYMKTLEDGFISAVQKFESSLASAIVNGKADFSDLAQHIKQVFAQAMVQKFITGPLLGAFGLPGRAEGGPVNSNQPYVVGEKGPELFIPNSNGTIIPNDEMTSGGAPGAMMGSQTVNYNINAVDARSFKQLVAQDPEFIFNVSQAGARRVPG